jgi:hypothetical protein
MNAALHSEILREVASTSKTCTAIWGSFEYVFGWALTPTASLTAIRAQRIRLRATRDEFLYTRTCVLPKHLRGICLLFNYALYRYASGERSGSALPRFQYLCVYNRHGLLPTNLGQERNLKQTRHISLGKRLSRTFTTLSPREHELKSVSWRKSIPPGPPRPPKTAIFIARVQVAAFQRQCSRTRRQK